MQLTAFLVDGAADLLSVAPSERLPTLQRVEVATLAGRPLDAVVSTGRNWTLVPQKLFLPQEAALYLSPVSGGTVYHMPVAYPEAVLIYEAPPLLAELSGKHIHLVAGLLALESCLKEAQENFCILYLCHQQLWLSLCRQGTHVVEQRCRVRSADDVVYYTAALLQHFGVQQDTCTMFIGGGVTDRGLIWRRMQTYFEVADLGTAVAGRVDSIPAATSLIDYQTTLRQALPEAQ